MGCIGVYFWLVLCYWQSQKSPYMIYEMEYITDPNSEEVNNYTKAFGITAVVSALISIGT